MARRPESDERLADWVDDRLSARDRERLEAEFGVNPELKSAAEDYRKMVEALRGELQREGDAPDLSDRIMAGIDAAPKAGGQRRIFPLMASAAAAAAILLTFFALDLMPGAEQAAPTSARPQQLASGEEITDSESQDLDPKTDDDFAFKRKLLPELRAENAGKAAATPPLELSKSVADLPSPAAIAEKQVIPRSDSLGLSENERDGKKELGEKGISFEQILRDNLRTQTAAAGKDAAGLAGGIPQQPELVLVVELPGDALSDMARSDLREAEGRGGRASRSRSLARPARTEGSADNQADPARQRWLSDAEGFIQEPLRQYGKPGAPPSPQVQGGYLRPESKNQMAADQVQAQGEFYQPKQEDVYFNVAGDDQAIIDYVRELKSLTEERNGRILAQWTTAGSIEVLPMAVLDLSLGERGKVSTEDEKKPSLPANLPIKEQEKRFTRQRRQNFVLRQRK